MRVGLYAGTFDPVTYGHLDIFRRSATLVDRLVIGVAINTEKQPLFDLHERVDLISHELESMNPKLAISTIVYPFENLLVDCAKEVEANIIIRGLRAVSDFEFEFQMVGMNRVLNNSIETVFLMADARNQAISSKLVKEIARLDGDVSQFVSKNVQIELNRKFNQDRTSN